MKLQEQWIAKAIVRKFGLEALEIKKPAIALYEIGCSDVTPYSWDLLATFAPDIKLLGYELKKERETEYFGVMMRALVNDDDKNERCLQYLFVYGRQLGIVSLLWMSVIPMILAVWAVLIATLFPLEMSAVLDVLESGQHLRLFTETYPLFMLLATGGVWSSLIIAGLRPHYGDWVNMPKGRRLHLRSTTLLIPYGLLEFVAVYSVWVPIVLFSVGFAWFVVWIMQRKKMAKGEHPMDYVPVFIWVTWNKENQPKADRTSASNWDFSRACWDYYHYNAVTKGKDDLQSNRANCRSNYLSGDKQTRVTLLMDNMWHSLFLGTQPARVFPRGILVMIISGTVIIIAAYLETLLGYTWSRILFLVFGFLIVFAAKNAARFPSELESEWKEKVKKVGNYESHLSRRSRELMWNLADKQARLAIVSKLQDPFNTRSDFYDTFRDEPIYLIYYIIKRIQGIETRLSPVH